MAHWIIEDRGFGGVIYKCSNCGSLYNNIFIDVDEVCPGCSSSMDRDEDEYID